MACRWDLTVPSPMARLEAMALDRGERVLAVRRRADDLEIVLALEELREPLEDHAVVIGEHETDHAPSPAKPSGTAISTCAPPSLESTIRSPLRAATRSASMNGPLPVSRMLSRVRRPRNENPTPSSLTSMRILPSAVCTRTSTFFAAPCLAEFITASCTKRKVSYPRNLETA